MLFHCRTTALPARAAWPGVAIFSETGGKPQVTADQSRLASGSACSAPPRVVRRVATTGDGQYVPQSRRRCGFRRGIAGRADQGLRTGQVTRSATRAGVAAGARSGQMEEEMKSCASANSGTFQRAPYWKAISNANSRALSRTFSWFEALHQPCPAAMMYAANSHRQDYACTIAFLRLRPGETTPLI